VYLIYKNIKIDR